MTQRRSVVLFLIMLLSVTACAHSIHQVHMGDFNPYTASQKGRKVSVNTEQSTILGFVRQINYVDNAFNKLLAKCPKGRLVGITTEHMTNLGFFSWTNRIYMKGQCV